MKTLLLLLALTTTPAHAAYKLVWSDEFNTNGRPDPEKWTYQTGGNGWGNGELEFYTNRLENSRIENGNLLIEARKEDFEKMHYTSARMNSAVGWKYGKFEVRAKLPRGRGTWPAIWMMPANKDPQNRGWPDTGEIDIMEHVGYWQGLVHATLHMKSFNWMKHNQKTAITSVANSDGEFHVYSMEWTAKEISIFVDGVRFFTYENPRSGFSEWPFDNEFKFILNTAIGGSWGGQFGVDDSIFPQKLTIDYVRVYQDVR